MPKTNEEKEELIKKNERARKYLATYMLLGDNLLDDVCAVLDIPMDKNVLEEFLFGHVDIRENALDEIFALTIVNASFGIKFSLPTEDDLGSFIKYLKAN